MSKFIRWSYVLVVFLKPSVHKRLLPLLLALGLVACSSGGEDSLALDGVNPETSNGSEAAAPSSSLPGGPGDDGTATGAAEPDPADPAVSDPSSGGGSGPTPDGDDSVTSVGNDAADASAGDVDAEPPDDPDPGSEQEPSDEEANDAGGSATDGEPEDGDPEPADGGDDPMPEPEELGPVTLYYLDVTEAEVMVIEPGSDDAEILVADAGRGPDGVAVDPVGGHIYWTNMGVPAENNGFILRSDLDGENVTTIVEEGDTYTPKQLKIELETGKLYWGDREGMRVQRCNLDGSELETLVTIAEGSQAREDRANHVVGISVDVDGGYFYWIQKGPPNGGEGSIRRAQLEMPAGETHQTRTDVEVLYAGLPEPIDLDVDVDAGMMYWTDRGDATINRSPVEIPDGATAGTRDDREILVEGVEVAIGVWLDLPLGHVYYTGNDVVGRVNLDGSDDTVLVPNAGVLTGITAVRLP